MSKLELVGWVTWAQEGWQIHMCEFGECGGGNFGESLFVEVISVGKTRE